MDKHVVRIMIYNCYCLQPFRKQVGLPLRRLVTYGIKNEMVEQTTYNFTHSD